MKRYVLFSLLAALSWMVGCGGSSSTSGGGGGGSRVTLVSISLTPSTPTLTLGKTQPTQQFKAVGSYSDGSTKDITATSNWLSSITAVATINTSGLATGISAGTTTISASSGTVSSNTVLMVNPAPLVSIAVTPSTASIAPGSTQQFTAKGTYADGSTQDLTSTATWQSSNSAIATITAAGLATGVAPGTVTISATSGSVSGTASLTVTNPLVSIAVTPANSSAAPETKPQFTATGTYFDHTSSIITTTVTWSSSNPAAATISNAPGLQGLATAVAQGTTTITATQGTISGSTPLTVTNATLTSIAVTPSVSTISLFVQQQYTATGAFSDNSQQDVTNIVTWSSSNTSKVTITVSGLATGVGVTTTPVMITAAYKEVSDTANVTVDAANLVSIAISSSTPASDPTKLAQGTSRHFMATGTFANGSTLNITNQATWTLTQSPTVATVGVHTGLVKALPLVPSPRTPVTITATLGSVSKTSQLMVTNATPTSLTVTPITATIPVGINYDFGATAIFNDGSTQDISMDATWTSSNSAEAKISSPGRAVGISPTPIGPPPVPVTITATFGGQSNTPPAHLTVSPATLVSIAVLPAQTTVAPGSTVSFTATGTYSDGTKRSLAPTWTTSDKSVVTIINPGIATGESAGSATITASYQQIKSTAAVVVTPSPLTSIAVTPATASVPEGVTTEFTATGTFMDLSTQNLTSSVTWASATPSVATVSNAYPFEGFATGVGPGTTNITAVFASKVSAPATLTVSTATLKSIAITPGNPTVTHPASENFTAKGTFSDGSVIDLTTQVSWSSSNVTVATISNVGQANTASTGSTTITATFVENGVTTHGTTTLTVN